MTTESIKQPPTPTLDRISAIGEQSQAIGEFIEWLHDNGYEICKRHEADRTLIAEAARNELGSANLIDLVGWFIERAQAWQPVYKSIDSLLHEFFEIDPN